MVDHASRQAVAARLRLLADRLATDDHAGPQWDGLATDLAAALDALPGPAVSDTRFARAHAEPEAGTDPSSTHPLATQTSGVYPPLHFEYDEGQMVATTIFGPAWEGPPGLVHGGFLAAGFDIVLSGLAHHLMGTSVTRWLRVRYLKPTFLNTPLRFVVTADEPNGRLLDLQATLFADDRVTMRATAQFATLDAARFAARRSSTQEPAAGDLGPS
ncbi:MAG: thioesterase superfamily enzyme [Acidimicrobiales bacterium]|nr:thioesterase superfamily enzyme [Acidimicrobiales bacterium]